MIPLMNVCFGISVKLIFKSCSITANIVSSDVNIVSLILEKMFYVPAWQRSTALLKAFKLISNILWLTCGFYLLVCGWDCCFCRHWWIFFLGKNWSSFLSLNFIKDALSLSGLRQFLTNKSPLKVRKNTF